MSKKKLAKVLGIVSSILVMVAMISFTVSMFTITKTLTASLFAEGAEEPFQLNITEDPTTGVLNGVARLKVSGRGFMSTNVSATLKILDAQGNILFSGSNYTIVSPGEIKYLTMKFSLSRVDFRMLRGKITLGFRTFFNLVGIEFSSEISGEGG